MINVTGVGEENHVTASNFRNMLIGIFGTGSYILDTGECFAHTLVSNNQLDVGTGMMCHHGNLSEEEKGASITITNGAQGMKRIDLIVNRYQRNDANQVESNEWVYIMGTPHATNPIAPEYMEGNVANGELIDDCPVFKVTLDGLNVESVELLVDRIKPLSQKQNQIIATDSEPTGGEHGDVFIQFEE